MVRRIRPQTYIHKLKGWPGFRWDHAHISARLADVRHRQGRLIGRMETLGFPLRAEAVLETLTEDVLKSSEIEGEKLDHDQVRSSIAARLGLDIGGLTAADRNVEGVVEMMLDATQGYDRPLTARRLFDWHAALFPLAAAECQRSMWAPGATTRQGPCRWFRGDRQGTSPLRSASGRRLREEMKKFLEWFEKDSSTDLVLKAGVAHLWFVTIHPFDDGNGRIARAIADMVLARSERSPQRFYSMSAQIRQERKAYYEILEATQKGDLEITRWLEWFLDVSAAPSRMRKPHSKRFSGRPASGTASRGRHSTIGSGRSSISCSMASRAS